MPTKKIIVTGGAGYIGSVAAKKLIEKGFKVTVIDNLSKGRKKLVHKKATFYKADLIDLKTLHKIFEKEKPGAVMHFAAYKSVGESEKNPVKYSQNITSVLNLLNVMSKVNCKKIIYSSSAAVYGNPRSSPIDENHPTNPINYYGSTKLMGEKLIELHSRLHNLQFVSLRYFNVIGDGGFNYIDPSPENILPLIMEAVFQKRNTFTIFGEDYPTTDGTCIRDYVDVNDIVEAHLSALSFERNAIINLGSSKGLSVKELLEAVKKVTSRQIRKKIGPRRKGDPPILIASNQKAKKLLGWSPKTPLEDSIRAMYRAYASVRK